MSKFYSLPVLSIRNLTSDAVCIKLDTSKFDADLFNFISGQYITIDHNINNEDVRRAYSISSSPEEGLEVGVKLVQGGLMSTFLNRELKLGDTLKVMPPVGDFVLDVNNNNSNSYVGICSGSGITPILSMIKNVLKLESNSSFSLIYGNKSVDSTMFSEELNALDKLFGDRLRIINLYSREKVNGALEGRIDEGNLNNIFNLSKEIFSSDSYFLCGPGDMIETVSSFLESKEIDKNKINFELFSSPTISDDSEPVLASDTVFNVTICMDGDDFDFELAQNGDSILDAAIQAGADVPYSCKGGVCSVCKAKVMEGSASMNINYSLSEEDVEEGYILTCQAHPTSNNLVVDYDEI